MGVDANRDVAMRYLNDVIGGGKLGLIDELVHWEAQDLSGPWPKGREGFREHVSGFRSAFEPEVSIQRVIADEEYAAVYWRGKGRHVGRAFGLIASCPLMLARVSLDTKQSRIQGTIGIRDSGMVYWNPRLMMQAPDIHPHIQRHFS